MRKNPEISNQVKKMSRRKMMLLAIQGAGILALGARAKNLQVEQNEKFLLLAESNRIDTRLSIAPRGIIYDASGRKIADNIPNFVVLLNKEACDDPALTLNNLSQITPISDERKKQLLLTIEQHTGFSPISLVEHLSWREYVTVSENLPALKGCQTQIALSRIYPFHEYFAHEVGYIGKVSPYRLSQMDEVHPIYRGTNAYIGLTGIEALKEESLRGQEGRTILEKNVHGRVIRELDKVGSVAGDELQLTLDAEFQIYGATRLKDESASAVVMDVETGDIKLMVSSPSFNPNPFVFGISDTEYKELTENPLDPLYNKSVSGQYPPGSTFKMVTALAALEAGAINPYDRVRCTGKINRGRDFNCWKRSGHGNMNLRDSLKHSCDVYYYTNSEKTGINNIAAMARKLGLGKKYDLPLNLIRKGLIGDIDWKKKTYDQDWVVGDTFNASIGQGFIETTPLQLAVMTSRIASGKAVEPKIISKINGKDQVQEFETLDIKEEHLNLVRDGMFAVSNDRKGTAYSSRIQGDGVKWAGKTGTAQTRNISKAERDRGVTQNKNLPWHLRDHALFVAFAPYDKPKYAVSIIVEHGGGGSSVAAPLARDLMLYALHGGEPPLSAYPASSRSKAASFMASVPKTESVIFDDSSEDQPVEDSNLTQNIDPASV